MSKKRREDKKKRKKKNAEGQKAKKRARHERQRSELNNIREVGRPLRPYLRAAGCDLPFYDYIDSWEDEFSRVVEHSISSFESLVGVHEVASGLLDEHDWSELGYGHFTQLFFSLPEERSDYIQSDPSRNIRGNVTFFHDDSGALRSVILLEKRSRVDRDIAEFGYASKLGSLLHEVGHVVDAENGRNFRFDGETVDIIEAEVFANIYALEQMADRALRCSYEMYYEAFEKHSSESGYIGEVASQVIERHPRRTVPDWREYIEAAGAIAFGDSH